MVSILTRARLDSSPIENSSIALTGSPRESVKRRPLDAVVATGSRVTLDQREVANNDGSRGRSRKFSRGEAADGAPIRRRGRLVDRGHSGGARSRVLLRGPVRLVHGR